MKVAFIMKNPRIMMLMAVLALPFVLAACKEEENVPSSNSEPSFNTTMREDAVHDSANDNVDTGVDDVPASEECRVPSDYELLKRIIQDVALDRLPSGKIWRGVCLWNFRREKAYYERLFLTGWISEEKRDENT
jgi:hypothetical protein